MNRFLYILFVDKLARYWNLLSRHLLSMIICTIVIVVILYIRLLSIELAQDNSNNLLMLGSELLCEIGPDFAQSAQMHTEMLEKYSAYMDQNRSRIPFIHFFSDEYNVKKGLDAASATLTKSESDPQKTALSIWRAGERILEFQMRASGARRAQIILGEPPEVPKRLLDDTTNAVRQSRDALQQTEKNPNVLQNYFDSRQANRRSMLLLFLSRSACNNRRDLFLEFKDIVEKTKKLNEKQAINPSISDPQRELHSIIADGEQRHLQVLNALMNENMEGARSILWHAIEKAYSDRPRTIEINTQLNLSKKLKN